MASGECKVDAGEELFLGISNDQQCHVWHKGVKVPEHHNPFTEKTEEWQFFEVLIRVIDAKIEPTGYGLHWDEWIDGEYLLWEFIKIGKWAGKEIQVSLEDPLWKTQAVLWMQGLNVLSHFDKLEWKTHFNILILLQYENKDNSCRGSRQDGQIFLIYKKHG
jgi:hypothetical protein